MSTNGMISIVKNGETIVKVIAGCDGYNAESATQEIIEYIAMGGEDLEDIYEIAVEKKFGCKDCLTVLGKKRSLCKGYSSEPISYRETFDDPQFNPRNKDGSVEYLFIIPMKEKL